MRSDVSDVTYNIHNFKRCEKLSSTPAGWHICRNGWQRSRTPAGCNMLFAFRTNRAVERSWPIWNRRYCTPLGCASAVTRFYKYATPLGWMIFHIFFSCGFFDFNLRANRC